MVRRYLPVAVALGVLLGPAGMSRAAVSIGNSRVVVSARGATAIVDRDPSGWDRSLGGRLAAG